MQLQTSGHGPTPGGMQMTQGHPGVASPYHGPPPNVMVSSMGPVSSGPGGPPGPNHMGPPHPGGPHGPPMMGGPPHPHQIMTPDGPVIRGPPPPGHPGGPPFIPTAAASFPSLESRIYEMNKRIQQRSEVNYPNEPDHASLWWDAFGTEFFDDDAQLTLKFQLDDGMKKYTIGRTLIPRYFRSIFDGGVKDLFYVLRYPIREFLPAPGIAVLESENAAMFTRHGKEQGFTEVYTEGRLVCEFNWDDPYQARIRQWFFEIRQHQEFVPRHVLTSHNTQDPSYQETIQKNITRQGMTSVTLNYLRLCVILEPMQQLMSQNKTFQLPPRECLKTTLFQRFNAANPMPQPRPPAPISNPQVLMPPDPSSEPPARTTGGGRRKRPRKPSQSTPTGGKKNKNTASPAPQPTTFGPMTSHVPPKQWTEEIEYKPDVMVVGEPSLMGGDYGEEDERMISRMENTQFDPAVGPTPSNPAAPPPVSEGPPTSAGGCPPFDPSGSGGMWTGGPGGLHSSVRSRTPHTPVSRTATPSGRISGSPSTVGANGRPIKTENLDNGTTSGSGTPSLP